MKILCFGDSLTWGYTPYGGRYMHPWPDVLQSCRPQDSVINEGMPGRTAFRSEKTLASLLKRNMPDLTVIMLGSNDLSRDCGRDIPQVLKDIENDGVEAEGYGKVLVLAPPEISEDVNPGWNYQPGIAPLMKDLANGISELCKKYDWEFFNTQQVVRPDVPDGLHLNEESHILLGKAVSRYLDTFMKKDEN